MAPLITNLDDLRPALLTSILCKNGLIGQASVKAINVLVKKELQVSTVARLKLEYSSAVPASAPSTIFLKLSKPTDSLSLNKSEVDFYYSIGPAYDGPPLIRCYDASYGTDLNASHILMEDLSDTHFQSPDGEFPAIEFAELAVKSVAQFHADWTDHPELGKSVGTIFDKSWLKNFLSDLRSSVQSFIEFLGPDLTKERRMIYEQMLAFSQDIWGRLTIREGLTVTHGDLHWWNFLFPRELNKDTTRIIDWQLWHIDLGARDLAFLIALGGFAERRPDVEMHLVRVYHETLITKGLSGYEWALFWNDYRFSAIRNLNLPVIFWSQGKHPETYLPILDRAFDAFDVLGCGELIGGVR